jgi:hypothetical protein
MEIKVGNGTPGRKGLTRLLPLCSASSCLAAGVSGVVSVSSRAQSIQSDNGYETRSIASGSSWSLLSALQLEPLSNAASAPNLSPGKLLAASLADSFCSSPVLLAVSWPSHRADRS